MHANGSRTGAVWNSLDLPPMAKGLAGVNVWKMVTSAMLAAVVL